MRAAFLGQIPIDPEICYCGDTGESVFQKVPKDGLLIKSLLSIATSVESHCALLKKNSKDSLDSLDSFELVWRKML